MSHTMQAQITWQQARIVCTKQVSDVTSRCHQWEETTVVRIAWSSSGCMEHRRLGCMPSCSAAINRTPPPTVCALHTKGQTRSNHKSNHWSLKSLSEYHNVNDNTPIMVRPLLLGDHFLQCHLLSSSPLQPSLHTSAPHLPCALLIWFVWPPEENLSPKAGTCPARHMSIDLEMSRRGYKEPAIISMLTH